ncbi:DUF1329 domain-containing protein [Echinimonas agarilytica]|uniref:DUF1329 domain-containing protein n=1 Tax=Echinimonas agarilytica TaxID=1215918 RepID=A0AA42B928_9GAMM|nr:DUF1329 domain-containing protein [Echinimonas agarilytica]MCM2681158.1 DUF1329 domain-containing protein [Echinimonas agarilytica]
MMKYKTLTSALTFALVAVSGSTLAAVTAEEAAELGKSLTPLGAVVGANSDGSIPAWTGGITAAPAGYSEGDHHPDPFAADKIEYTVTAANYKDYDAVLTDGQKALFETYPDTFKMNVYKTHRSASFPQYIYDGTIANATRSSLADSGNGIVGAGAGIPFPIPKSGLEVIWNHIFRFRGVDVGRSAGQAAPMKSGAYTYIQLKESIKFLSSAEDVTPEKLQQTNMVFKFKQSVTQPARLAGTALLVHETMDQVKQPRQAWTYNTGQRRVRRAPNVAYDTPGTASDGLRTTDDYDMYNGSPDRYEWNLIGKQELLIPYNSYKLHSDTLKNDDILKPGHIEPELVRYEKHRVWVVEAQLKPGISHIYKKRRFYIDEDSWQVSVADIYDNRDQLYRVAMAHALNYYEVPALWSTLEVFHDLQARRYIAIGLDNQEKMYDFGATLRDKDFTPAALRKEGRR